MKGFVISVALIVGALIYVMTSYDKLADYYLAKSLEAEGSIEAMREAQNKDEAAFIVKYRPLLATRWTVAHLALYLDDNYFLKVSKDTLDRYRETPLNKDEGYGKILFQRAQLMEERIKPPNEAFLLFKEHDANFGTTPEASISRSAMIRLSIKYGMQ